MSKKNLLKLCAFVICISVLGLCIYTYVYKSPLDTIVTLEPQYVADFSDDRVLMGASHNVFIGKVIAQSGTKERGTGPETQFEVEVIDNIKGELKGTVTVNQEGGYKDGILYVIGEEGDTLGQGKENTYLLQIGSTYVFVTRYNSIENWYTINSHPAGRKLLSGDANIDVTQLKSIGENDLRVSALKSAYSQEILLDADIKSKNTRNSYASMKEKSEK